MANDVIRIPSASRQVAFHQLLVGARKTILMDALSETLSQIDPTELKNQMIRYVPRDAQMILAGAGIRDEHVFPAPIILETAPTLIGYYRLLLGVSRKSFYIKDSGMQLFSSMESNGSLNDQQKAGLDEFCKVMSRAFADLVRQISPTITSRDVHDLPLLTFGSQLQGGYNNTIGKIATNAVLLSLNEIVENYTVKKETRKITINNNKAKICIIKVAGDPDIVIDEITGKAPRKIIAIEIKGGTDVSNIHNRAGEAEKSHLKAKGQGYIACWTIIHKKGLDMEKIQGECPTTDLWFDISQIIVREGNDWDAFKIKIAEVIDIPIS